MFKCRISEIVEIITLRENHGNFEWPLCYIANPGISRGWGLLHVHAFKVHAIADHTCGSRALSVHKSFTRDRASWKLENLRSSNRRRVGCGFLTLLAKA